MQKAGAVKRMIAELTLLRMCDPTLDTGAEALLARVEKLEDALSGGAQIPPKPASAPEGEPPKEPEKPKTPANGAQKAAEAPSAAPANAPEPGTAGRTLRRVRGFADCVERVRRENSMLASFLEEAKAFLDETGKPVIQLQNEFALSLTDTARERALLAGALSAELQKSFAPGDLILEAPGAAETRDTVIDDLLSAAEENGN